MRGLLLLQRHRTDLISREYDLQMKCRREMNIQFVMFMCTNVEDVHMYFILRNIFEKNKILRVKSMIFVSMLARSRSWSCSWVNKQEIFCT